MKRTGKNWQRGVLAAAALLLGAASLAPLVVAPRIEADSTKQPAGIAWRTGFAEAQAEAKRTGKPLLVEFSASWCPPCRMMDQTTFRDKAVVALSRQVTAVKVDLDQNEALARRFGVTGIPHSFILTPAGRVVLEHSGYSDPAGFAAFLRSGIERSAR